MDPTEVGRLIETRLTGARAEVTGDGRHFDAVVISEQFEGKNRIRRHQLVFGVLREYLNDDAIHALSLKTFTPEDWERQQPSG